ncbi:SRPBCC family protein [Mycobacteroides abscessus subsp. bolletii]|uniref:SRPBCC family protein n=1 Tax=Mycobacteroides abscessus TaxID=36809 RepID=UPI0019D02B7B|nr:SRPBCC family protein [Mycobacteroides abscessus]MBN7303153.1 SRPBCC family protein [Mycobacteroides abscessus subsp. bolletii]
MDSPAIFHRVWRTAPVDDSTFETAPLVFTTGTTFDAPVTAVWDVFDSDTAWEWLPFSWLRLFGAGVRYLTPARGVGVVREMGSVHGIWRMGWIEHEKFWRYEPHKRVSYGVERGNWLQRIVVRQYAEHLWFDETPDGRTKVTWQIALNLRGVFRIGHYLKPIFKFVYRFALKQAHRQIAVRHQAGSIEIA